MKIFPIQKINFELENIASDKSISHRFAIFSLLSDKVSTARNYLQAEDTLNTLKIVENLGAIVEKNDDTIKITPPKTIQSPNCILDCGNSGTAMRLLMGFLSVQEGFFVLSGDQYLNKRPMKRISMPLVKLGAKIYGRENANYAPLCIEGTQIQAFDYQSDISSAQVKTAMILAAFRAQDTCYFKEVNLSRNHSENMLISMNAPIIIDQNGLSLKIDPLKKPLKPLNIEIPNDPSSAFYFALAACILPEAKICIKNVLLNPTRIEAYKILEKMGAKITYNFYSNSFEDIGEIYIESSNLNGVVVDENISWLIDEAPALAIAFACADGISELKNAQELRVKESDRIKSTVENLLNCGIDAVELEDGFRIKGSKAKFAKIKSYGDHRIAMSFAILGLICGMEIDDDECINTSFPNFKEILLQLGAKIED